MLHSLAGILHSLAGILHFHLHHLFTRGRNDKLHMVLLLLLLLPLSGGKDKDSSPRPLLVERGDDDLSWLPHSLLILPASVETRVETIVFFTATL
jgi:hypothetical protein